MSQIVVDVVKRVFLFCAFVRNDPHTKAQKNDTKLAAQGFAHTSRVYCR